MTRVRRSAFFLCVVSTALLAVAARAQDPMNYPSVLNEQRRRARQNRPKDAREALPVTLDPGSGLPAELGPWLPVGEALEHARAEGRLVLLYVRGRDGQDVDRWWFEVATDERVRRGQARFVVAQASARDAVLAEIEGTQQSFSHSSESWIRRTPASRLFILDAAGSRVLESALESGDVDLYVAMLNSIDANRSRFLDAGRVRREGKRAEALLLTALGLYDAGMLPSARDAFSVAREQAEIERNLDLEQHATLGIAAVDTARRHPSGAATARKIAGDAASPSIAANAWLIVGSAERMVRRTGAARQAYERALSLARPGSREFVAARRGLARVGVALADEVNTEDVHLSLPAIEPLFGEIVAKATVPAATARVEFLVDGRVVARDAQPPFSGTLQLDEIPRPRTVSVAAYDASGRRLGGDTAEVNRRRESLSVRIVSPSSPRVESGATVEVAAEAPAGSHVAAVDLYWNTTRIATSTKRPYRYELRLPAAGASGYLRAVARDDAGTTAEDVKIINSEAAGAEQVLVNQVELYAIVHNRRGENVRGLQASDLKVEEDGGPVQFELRGSDADAITIGIMLDVSASMRGAMLETFDYAKEFIRSSLAPGDRVFVVAANDEPQLLLPVTVQRDSAITAIEQLHMRGDTALWDSVMFSISQFTSDTGKRALLIFTDGLDNASRATLKNVLAFSQQKGVPIYTVFPGPVSTSVDDWGNDSLEVQALRDVSAATAGAVFLSPSRADLPRIFGRVRDDTRAEYLLTYNSASTRPSNELRKVKVSAKRSGIIVRAPSGYYPR